MHAHLGAKRIHLPCAAAMLERIAIAARRARTFSRRRPGRGRGAKFFRTILLRARGADTGHARECKAVSAEGDKIAE